MLRQAPPSAQIFLGTYRISLSGSWLRRFSPVFGAFWAVLGENGDPPAALLPKWPLPPPSRTFASGSRSRSATPSRTTPARPRARDRAIAATKAPWLCITDHDMDPAPGYQAAHLAALEHGGERTVVIGNVEPEEGWQAQPLYEAMRSTRCWRCTRACRTGSGAPRARCWSPRTCRWPARPTSASAASTSGCASARTRSWAGGRSATARFVFAQEARAIHRTRVGSYDTWLRRQFQYGRNAVYIHRKLGGDPRSHPLRNLLNGHRLKRAAVEALRWSHRLGRTTIAALRSAGKMLQDSHLTGPAVASHTGIMAIASWGSRTRSAPGRRSAPRAGPFARPPGARCTPRSSDLDTARAGTLG